MTRKKLLLLLLLLVLAQALTAAPPTLVELRPRGAERGRPFTLTILGRDIPEGAKIWSTMPATFTPVVAQPAETLSMAQGRSAQFLVEPRGDLTPGVYPIRIETSAGISNVLLFSVGTFPELTEQESLPYSQPNRNDTIENSEPVQTVPVTLNGTIRGAERDLYRVSGKAGETRVFEVESRRCGSAVDAVLRILDGSGNQLARSDDAQGAGLDPRIEFKFPREGYYYVEVRDARFSTQAQNFYRLKMGAYPHAESFFPLGAQRGQAASVTFSGGNLAAPLKTDVDLKTTPELALFTTVAIPNSPVMPFLFAVGNDVEWTEPPMPISAPGVINGRLTQPGEADRYKIQVTPGEKLLIEVQARELGTSKLEAIITAYDPSGKKLDSAGDKPLPEDVFAVQGTSRTSNDPFLNLRVPEGVHEITLGIEDLAGRGGANYGYRVAVRKQGEDFRLSVATPQVNIPKGGTAIVAVNADRRGYDGPIELTVADLPKGVRVEGGTIPREYVDPNNARSFNRRGVLILSADADTEMPARELVVWGTGKLADGTELRRRARGSAMAVEVAGAVSQGVVDRQRALTAPWLGLDLPAASTLPQDATLEVKQTKFTRMEEGDRYDFEYKWNRQSKMVQLPDELAVEIIGARETRVTAMQKSGDGGTFSISITRSTDPANYDVITRGRIRSGGEAEEVYARPISLVVTERRENAQAVSSR